MPADERVPLLVEHARPFVEVHLPSASRVAVAWLDTGGGPFIVGSDLGDDLGLTEREQEVNGQMMSVVDLPAVEVGGKLLKADECLGLRRESRLIADGFPAEAFVPASALAQHRVVFDYPGRTFALDPSDPPSGSEVAVASYPRPGWPVARVSLGGEEVNLLVDTGASCSMLSDRLVERLGGTVVARVPGAFGLANMNGGEWEARVATIGVADFTWGGVALERLVAVTRPEGNFERMMSAGTPVAVEGAIAGNVLEALRFDWNAQEQRAWLDAVGTAKEWFCQVPLVLQARHGVVRIVGVGEPAGSEGVRVGDELLQVDGAAVDAAAFGALIERLEGPEGTAHVLGLRRGDDLVDVQASVVRLPG